jgi:pimeloyl-ACP methyl ester carboxylesterase
MQIIVKNIATEYTDEGEGSVILLLHGWQSNLHTFDAITSLLSKKLRVIRLDLPGFGKTEMPPSAWHIDDYAQFVAEFIRKLGIELKYIAGHSFGGRVIIKAIATETIHPKKIILIASAGVAERRKTRAAIIKILTKTGSAIMWIPPLIFWRTKMRERLYGYLGSDYLDAGNLKETYLNIIKEDLSLSAKEIKKPTLLIWGDHDVATPIKEGLRLSHLIKGSTLKVIEGAGHFVHQEQPQRVAEYMNTFLHD